MAALAPSVARPALAAPAADGVDEAALSFLLRRALEDKRKEEQLAKEKEEEMKRQVWDSLELKFQQMLHESSSSTGRKRKRKKRRKRRTPRTSSLPGLARRRQRQWHVSLRHVVDVPVVQFVLFPQVLFADWISSNDEICADNYIYFRFKLIGKGRSEEWEVFLYCDKTIKMTVIARKCCPGVCLRLAFVVSASVLHPTWQRITPSMSCACLLSVTWNELESGRSTLERVVQWDVRVHGFSCGTCRDVLHSPLTVSTIDATTTVVALYSASADCTGSAVSMCSAGACVAMSCDGGCFTPDGAYDSLWVAMPMKESTPSIPSCTKRTLVCLHAEWLVQQQ